MSPWTVRESSHVLRDRWISLRSDTCSTPDGTIVSPYYVLEYPDSVNVVALTDADDVVMVRQYRHGIGQVLLELPCGTVDMDDESPLEAVRRELLEETGYTSDNFVVTGVLSQNPATHSNLTHCFLATKCRQIASPSPDETERLESRLVSLDEFVQSVLSARMLQSLHLSSAFLALAQLGYIRTDGLDSRGA